VSAACHYESQTTLRSSAGDRQLWEHAARRQGVSVSRLVRSAANAVSRLVLRGTRWEPDPWRGIDRDALMAQLLTDAQAAHERRRQRSRDGWRTRRSRQASRA
jgi:hypothetical protein